MPQTSRFPLFLIPRKLVAALVNRHHPRVNTNSIPANTVLNTNPISTQMKQMEGYLEFPYRLTRGMADVAQRQRRVEWRRWRRLHCTVIDLWARLVSRRRARRGLYDNLVRLRRLSGQFDIYAVMI